MGHGGGGRAGRLALWPLGAAVALLALAQLLLPRIAASTISSRVGRYGSVRSVSVSAWPAVKLLWGSADSVRVHAGSLRIEPQQAAKLLWESRGVSRMDLWAQRVNVGGLALTDARVRQRGHDLSAEARVGEAAVRAALPAGLDVRLLRSGGGQVEVRASGGLFGVGAAVDAVALASEGKLVAHPVGLPVEGLRLTIFSDPHVYVEGVGADVQSSGPLSYRLTMRARLR